VGVAQALRRSPGFIAGSLQLVTLRATQLQVREEVPGLAVDSGHWKLSRGIKKVFDVTKAWAGKLVHNAEWILGRRVARVLGIVALFAVVVALSLVFLNWYVAPDKPGERKDLVLALAQILGGTALLSGLYFTWRTLQVNREGQLTERFTRAIDQLGAPQLELRLGSIYALERIDKESPERAYHRTVTEVLTAYIRENSGRDRGESSRPTSASNEDAEQDRGVEQDAEPTPRRPAADIQAILNVLNRRQLRSVPKDRMHHLDLRGADLERASLVGANLEGANLQEAALEVADLRKAVLREARNLFQEQIEKASGDETTQLPTHLNPPANWGVEHPNL
jgi:hypothetical protein